MSRRAFVAAALVAIGLAGAGVAGCGNTPPLPPPPSPPLPVVPPAPLPGEAAAPQARETPDAPFREQMPKPDGSIAFTPPKIESFTLKSGLKVMFVERHDLPVVSVAVVEKGGAGDWREPPGVLAFVGAMLEQGTKTRTALQLSDEFEEIGAKHGAWVGWDSGGAQVQVLSQNLDRALTLLADVVTNPIFPDAEIERLRARRLAAIQMEKNSPRTIAQNALGPALYGRGHAYGNSLTGREADVKKITKDALLRGYKQEFATHNATIVAAGDVTKSDLQAKLEAAFGAWRAPGGAAPAAAGAPAAQAGAKRLVIVDRPNAPQSQVLVAETGIPMKAKDRDAVNVMNAILGGVFSSRINMNLREAHAYTYGAGSRFAMRHGAGPFSAGGAIFADKTSPAIGELFKEIGRITSSEVTTDELADAKEHIKLALPGRFETVGEVTDALEELAVYDLPLDEYATLSKRVDAVTAADVKKAAVAHLHPSTLRVVVVGDRKKLETGLEELKLGAPELRDAFGDLVP